MGAFSLQAATSLTGSVYSWLQAPYETYETKVEVTDQSDASKRIVGGVDAEGIFRFRDIPPGHYSIRITGKNVREVTLPDVTIVRGKVTDVGAIHMRTPCEERGGGCLGNGEVFRIDVPTKLEMIDFCAVDFDAQLPWCTVTLGMRGPVPPSDSLKDGFWFHITDGGVYLIPFSETDFSLNPTTVTDKHGCANATYRPGRIRIDGLPPSSRACMLMHTGYVELRFKETIGSGESAATIEFLAWLIPQFPNSRRR